MRIRTVGVDATRAVGAALAGIVESRDVVLLAGDLGAGKTAFTQGFGAALGIDEPITSPTFTLARQYPQGRLCLHHLDVYRLDRFSELNDLGIAELLDDDGVVVIEWGDAIAPAIPADFAEVRFSYTDDDNTRDVEIRLVGSRWSARSRILSERLADWEV